MNRSPDDTEQIRQGMRILEINAQDKDDKQDIGDESTREERDEKVGCGGRI